MRAGVVLGVLILSACNGPTEPEAGPTSKGGLEKVATAVKGQRFELASILAPGQVTIVKFTAPW